MKNDSIVFKKLLGFLIVAVAFTVAWLVIYRAEIMEKIYDSVGKNEFAAKRALKDAVLSNVMPVSLSPERNDVRFIQVKNMRHGETTTVGTPILLSLTNKGDSNDFPSIKVILMNSDKQVVREQNFGPTDYQHGDKFETEEIQLLVHLNPDERSFTVKLNYDGRS